MAQRPGKTNVAGSTDTRAPQTSSTTTTSNAAATARTAQVSRDQIARRAYEIFLARGCHHGRDQEDWLQAERELKLGRQ